MSTWVRCAWLLPLVVIATGCKHPPSVVGKWKGTVLQIDSVAEFKEDKSLSIDMKQSGMGVTLTGTYEITPKDLTVKVADYKLKAVPDTLAPLAKSLFDPFKGRPFRMTYQFNNEDEIALTYQGKSDVLKREVESQ